jgi:cyanophycinase
MSLDSLLQGVADRLPATAGPVGLLSGDEFLRPVSDFDQRLLDLTGARVGVIYCADHRAQPKSERYATKHFERLGAHAFTLDMHGGKNDEFDLAYIAGGSPKDLLEHLRDNPRWSDVLTRWKEGRGLAGSSAGAMVLCARTLTPERGARVPTTWTTGAGPVDGICLAVHASSRSKEWLEQVKKTAPAPLIALGDRTGIILRHREPPETIGPGEVWRV